MDRQDDELAPNSKFEVTGTHARPDSRMSDASFSTTHSSVREELLFEAQRRSAEHHLGEYLALRHEIWIK
jgi:hypothetical protein